MFILILMETESLFPKIKIFLMMLILILIETYSLFSRVKIFLTMLILILMETESHFQNFFYDVYFNFNGNRISIFESQNFSYLNFNGNRVSIFKIFLTMFILILMETESVAIVTQRFNFREKNNSSLHNSKFFLRYLF